MKRALRARASGGVRKGLRVAVAATGLCAAVAATGMRAAVAVVGMSVALGAAAMEPQAGPPQHTGIKLEGKHHRRGQAAIDGLGRKLPDVARWYGITRGHLEHMLRTDETLHVDGSGRLLYLEPPMHEGMRTRGDRRVAHVHGAVAGTDAPALAATSAPLEETFRLHSRPASTRKLYLDFNGQVVTGTWWNGSAWGTTINAAPLDLDGSPSTWSPDELRFIQSVWQRVAEDFAIFDVDVTTEEPSADALVRTDAADTAYGVRVVVTKDFTRNTVSPCNCGGASFLNTVGKPVAGPSWVFYDNLSFNEKNVAEAASHEAGHALGLAHDGTSTTAYYQGHGAGATSWAPIMGVGYRANVTQWSRGDYASANNKEDDIEIIGRSFPILPDDVADTYAQSRSLASTVAGTQQSLRATGLVGSASDVDVFNFAAGPGRIELAAQGAEVGPNTDLLLELRDAGGNILAAGRPGDALGAAVTHSAASAGQYYVVVTSTAAGDGSGSFPEYGSVGRYTITGTAPAVTGGGGGGGTPLQPPVAVVAASTLRGTAPLRVQFQSTGSRDPDGVIVAHRWTPGDGTAPVDGPSALEHVYTLPGTWVASLRVTDNSGLHGVASVSIEVQQPATTQSMQVNDITLRAAKVTGTTNVRRSISARVTVRDARGGVVPGATVIGNYWGDASGVVRGVTGNDGVVVLPSVTSDAMSGSVSFRVLDIRRDGWVYTPARNAETVDTVTWSAW